MSPKVLFVLLLFALQHRSAYIGTHQIALRAVLNKFNFSSVFTMCFWRKSDVFLILYTWDRDPGCNLVVLSRCIVLLSTPPHFHYK